MELASMLAGEPFTDRPESVCPVIAAFLRSYNDGIDDERRRDLYRLASESVGTRDQTLHELRSLICHEWIARRHRALTRTPFKLMPLRWRTLGAGVDDPLVGTAAGRLAAKLVRRYGAVAHEDALELTERLIGCSALRFGRASHGGNPPVGTPRKA
jgi:hypothetical protein